MPVKFLESLGSQLAEQWVVNLLTPAFVFWFGGALAWLDRWGWQALQTAFVGLDETLQLAVLIGALLVVVASGFALQRFDLAILRAFEGYWPRWMAPLRSRLLRQQRNWLAQQEQRWQTLQAKQGAEGLTPDGLDELTTLDWQLRQLSSRAERLMPTRLGNSAAGGGELA